MALDLIIKNPHIGEEHAEFKVKAQRSMTVRELKATLRDTYPTRPEASAQTLIHGGRVVRDEKKLDDVISKVRPQPPSPTLDLAPRPSRPAPTSLANSWGKHVLLIIFALCVRRSITTRGRRCST